MLLKKIYYYGPYIPFFGTGLIAIEVVLDLLGRDVQPTVTWENIYHYIGTSIIQGASWGAFVILLIATR